MTTRTSSTSRAVSVPNEVRNGATSGIAIRRISIPVIFMMVRLSAASPSDTAAGGAACSSLPPLAPACPSTGRGKAV
ncbi:hypothetical protein IMZ11_22500 [Microtetraspora sp. AC03309]|uniref:hypothetical protein n=1 Tax=Microtetraspora sp. AC03309 TaxID=2779376 RepID=UPI001E2B97CD|nr:hypothetical protein [Microtetraspora sp. AC03309]MCC5578404.1 hypothetical protein [Microtetraspora sp. AC03309]